VDKSGWVNVLGMGMEMCVCLADKCTVGGLVVSYQSVLA